VKVWQLGTERLECQRVLMWPARGIGPSLAC